MVTPDLASMLGGNSGSNVDVLIKFLESDEIEMKSRITSKQSKAIFKLKWLHEISKPENKNKTDIEILMSVLEYYLKIVVSIDGKRVEGIMETLKEMKPQINEQGLLGNGGT